MDCRHTEISRRRQSPLFCRRTFSSRDRKTFERILPRLLYRQLSPARRSRARQVHHGKARSPRQSTRRARTASNVVRGPEVTRSTNFYSVIRSEVEEWSEWDERHERLRREGSGERVGRRTSSIDRCF